MNSPLVRADELRALIGTVTVLDVRYRMGGPPGRAEHEAGHVPGASYVDLDQDLAAPPGPGGRHPLPELAAFEAAMRRAGVSGARPVVVYDDWEGRAAGRAWWLLRYCGHPDVRVLDGGWPAWLAAGGAVETGAVETGAVETGAVETGAVETGAATATPGDFVAVPGAMPVVEAEDVPAVAVLVDARAPERYRGEVEPVDPVAGHIPGAVNVPTTDNVGADGRFRSPKELRARYAEVGAVAGADVAAYCGSGVTACHDVLALEVAGVSAALYPGSWSGWVADPSRPVATSESP